MPEYSQVQTYVIGNKGTFSSVINTYLHVLGRLGYADHHVLDWLSQLHWPPEGEDIGYVVEEWPLISLVAAKEILHARVGVMIHHEPVTREQKDQWIELSLLFEAETLREKRGSKYASGVGRVLWRILSEFAALFRESGVYFTDEFQDGRTWHALISGQGDIWSFDVARIPKALAHHFQLFPNRFERAIFEEDFGFAWRDRWITLPWVE